MVSASMPCVDNLDRFLAIDDEPVLVRASDVGREPLAWLWPGRVPGSKVTLVAGDPGLGKSLVALDIAARVTRGLPWPDMGKGDAGRGARDEGKIEENKMGLVAPASGLVPPASGLVPLASGLVAPASGLAPLASGLAPLGRVVLLSTQDNVADTIRPRLEAAGADLNRVVILQAVRGGGDDPARSAERPFSMARDLPVLERALAETGDVRLIIVDPLSAYLGVADSQRAGEVRGLLTLLRGVAERWQCAVLAITHLNKNVGTQVMYRATGSLALVAAVRAVWAVARDPEQPGRHLLLPVKCNLARRVDGLAYRIAESPTVPGTPAVAWEREPVRGPMDDGLLGDSPAGRLVQTEREEVAGWLRHILTKGAMSVINIRYFAREAGYSWGTVKRAKLELPITHGPTDFGGPWKWKLRTDSDAPAPSPTLPQSCVRLSQTEPDCGRLGPGEQPKEASASAGAAVPQA